MVMMTEIWVVLIFLFLCWILGRSLILAFKEDCDWLAMPIGLCLVGLTSNALYFIGGFSAQMIQIFFLCVLILCLLIVFRRGVSFSEWGRLLTVLAVFLFLALPAFIGGEQYYVFRGNAEEHFNYIDETLAMRGNPYSAYKYNPLAICNYPLSLSQKALAAHKFLAQDVLLHGMGYIYARPAVGLVLAIILPDGRGNIHLLAFLYVTALWALVFAAACFAWRRILEEYALDKRSFLLLIGPPLAYVIGFWGQYIFDINSWSQMASLSLLLAFVFQYIRLVQYLIDPALQKNKATVNQYIITALLASGAYLFYPENFVPHAAFLLGATGLWCVMVRKIPRVMTVISLAIFFVVVLLISSVPNWKGTGIQFVIHQMFFGMAAQMPPWMYFDSYWQGIHGNGFFSHIKPAVIHGIDVLRSFHRYRLGIPPSSIFFNHIVHGYNMLRNFDGYWNGLHVLPVIGYMSTVTNFILALIGLFFLTPDYSMPFWLRLGWIFLTVILALGAVYSIVVSLFIRFRENQTTIFLKAFSITGILFLLFLFFRGSFWGFGKGLTYLSPYLFLVFCLGLVETDKRLKIKPSGAHVFGNHIIRWFIIIFIISQITFGGYRIWSAGDRNGIGYNNLTYPSIIGGATIKSKYLWQMDPNAYVHCKGVNLDGILTGSPVDAYSLEYIKQKFIYLGIPYFSSLPVRTFYHQSGVEVGNQPPIVNDCKIGMTKVADKWITIKL